MSEQRISQVLGILGKNVINIIEKMCTTSMLANTQVQIIGLP